MEFGRPERERALTRRWVQSAGAQLLVVDPVRDAVGFDAEMSSRGVHVTRVSSTIDALVEFGRRNPEVVIVSPRADGLPGSDLVRKLLEYGHPLIVAVVETGEESDTSLFLAGAAAAVGRPYTADAVWKLLQQSARALDDHVHVAYGPIVLDARAFTVHLDGKRVPDLALKEFELLRALMYRAPEMMTDAELRQEVWAGKAGDTTVKVHVRRLRSRLDSVATIRRVHGRGYALAVD